MKRSTVDAIFPSNDTPLPTDCRIDDDHQRASSRSSNIVYQKRNKAPASPQMESRKSSIVSTTNELENAMDSMGASPMRNERKMSMPSWMEKATGGNNTPSDVYVQEEIHPGIILEGYAVEC